MNRKPWPDDAPKGKTWKCPDCGSQATLGGNAGFHRDTEKHGDPVLISWTPEDRWEKYKANGRKTTPKEVLDREATSMFGQHSLTIQEKCPKCDIPLKFGLALQGQETNPDIIVEYVVYTNPDLKFDRCLKCPKCGHSKTLDN